MCDDNSESRVYFSNAAGVLNRDTSFIDLSLSQQELEAGNYGCTWTDIDVDGDADFYISRCRAGVDDITDLRRKNFLYIQENNQFYEKGDEYGIGIFDQSWCSTFRDLDGDKSLYSNTCISTKFESHISRPNRICRNSICWYSNSNEHRRL